MSTTATAGTTASSLLASTTARTGTTTGSSSEMSDRFMKLLVAQMNNQDPLNPLDNAQVTSQLAQINTVTGINGLNDTVAQLIGQMTSLQSLQAAQLTGRSVLVAGNGLSVAADAASARLGGAVQLAGAADQVAVQITDASGAAVRTLMLGAQPAGIARFDWDGKTDGGRAAPAGNYTYTLQAVAAGKAVDAAALVVRRVDGVSTTDGSVSLALAGGGSAAFGDVRRILG